MENSKENEKKKVSEEKLDQVNGGAYPMRNLRICPFCGSQNVSGYGTRGEADCFCNACKKPYICRWGI